jgi:hypothetical protein
MPVAGNVVLKEKSSTASLDFNLFQAREKFTQMENWLLSHETLEQPLHEVERKQAEDIRKVMQLMFQAHINARGNGAVGPALAVKTEAKMPAEEVVHTHRREHTKQIHSIFGEVQSRREGYGRPGRESIHPLDETLCLPKRSFSYEFQRRLCKASVQGPFHEAQERMDELTGLRISGRSVEQLLADGADDFDSFYEQRQVPAWQETGPILVGAVDGKGVPVIKPEKTQAVVRRGKGEKANKKKMATVAAVFTQKRRMRTPEEVVASLFAPQTLERQERRPPEHKRVWASLKKDKDRVLSEVRAEMERRDPQRRKIWTAVCDGERALQYRIKSTFKDIAILLILDFLHVLEKLWTTAYAFYEEGSAEAIAWVQKQALAILQGKVSQVVKGIRQSVTKRSLRGQAKKAALTVAAYLYRNRPYMRYHTYLKQGLPIASGSVEGACKNLIKDRMERSGMRWSIPVAEAIIKLRAVYLSGDFNEYWNFHVNKEQSRVYSAKWRPIGVVEK